MADLAIRREVAAELDRVRTDFGQLLRDAAPADLRRASDGTRWTNQELLFHMLFGYLIARVLLVLARLAGHFPGRASGGFARLLDAGTGPFDAVNYYGSRLGARITGPRRMSAWFDRVTSSLSRQLSRETDAGLRRGMHYPVRWDPFFKDYMTLADIYRYPTRHYDFHRRQLTLGEMAADRGV